MMHNSVKNLLKITENVKAKFSNYAEKNGAVWMWKKLALRGSTRSKAGSETLAYFVYEHPIGKLPRKPPIFVRLYDKTQYRAIRKLKPLASMSKNDFKGF